MSARIFVALDLETTGLDARTDAIIEVGAVRVRYDRAVEPFACQILERFVTFVNPQRSIPLHIQQLTGIRDKHVADAPTIERIVPELLAFVSADVEAVVAHNASFDCDFLQAAGVSFHRPIQDTFELASILLPRMTSYSLGELCRTLDIALPDAHRALDDAEATAQLFTHLLTCFQNLPDWIPSILAACGSEANWAPLSLLDSNALEGRDPAAGHPDAPVPPVAHLPQPVTSVPPTESLLLDRSDHIEHVDTDRLQGCFADSGTLAQCLAPYYEARAGQQTMAQRVLQSLNLGDHLLIEAGTGTGKSLAYLLPAALWSLTNKRRVVVATNTLSLQDQLLEKDIPLVSRVIDELGEAPLNAALLKGRHNYLCTRRLFQWYHNRQLSSLELRVLAKVLVWLLHTHTGDVSELFLPTPAERMIWARLCSDAGTCSVERCSGQYHGQSFVDFFFRARQAAEAAHILVVNHALLLADVGAGNRALPPYSHVIVDEAHHLEEAATEQFSYRVDWPVIFAQIHRIKNHGEVYLAALALARGHGEIESERMARQIAVQAQEADDSLRSFGHALLAFARNQDSIRTDFNYTQRLALDGRIRTQPAWSELEIQWDVTSHHLRAVIKQLAALLRWGEEHHWWLQEPAATVLQDLESCRTTLKEFVTWLDRIMFETPSHDDQEYVAWLEVNDTVSEVRLAAAPLYVNETLEHELVHRKRSAIFTGATLRTGSGFSFIRDRLGLWDVAAATVDSPFDYHASTLLYLPSDIPEPNQNHYQQAVEQAIIKAAEATSGATLALFTSYAQLRMTAEAIRAPLDRLGITVLQHGVSSRQRLLREYRRAEKAVLLGTRSFWEGIDLPGDELRCLLIVRLPFAVPSDPLVAARCAQLENPFRDYTLPEAILRFRQGFGRLIRRTTDRGVVVVLDARILRKEYGQAFLESLPECTVHHAPLGNLNADIERWLQHQRAPLSIYD